MEDNESSYSEVEEQKSSLPFLEEEAKEDKAGQLYNVEEWWKESKVEEELTGDGKMGNKDTSERVGDKPGSSMESLKQNLGDINNIQAMKHKDRICLLRLQRNLKELNDIARKKELEVQKHRDKLSTCQLRIKMLAKHLDYVGTEIEKEEEAGNIAALSRLWAVHRRLCTELEQEKDLELKIALTIKDDTLGMWRIETEQGKYETLYERLKKDEEELEMKYQDQAEVQIWEAKIAALQAEKNQQSRAKKEKEAQKEYEEKRKKILEDAKRNHEKAFCFLRKSMARIREKNAKEEVKTREHMERRIQAVLSLKTSLTSNREKLQALRAWNKAKALEAEKQEMKMREAILAEEGNVAKEIFLRKQLLKHEEEKQAFREQQKSRKIEIVSQILQEKASIHKRRKSQSCTKATKGGCKPEDPFPWRMKTWQYIEKACKHSAGASATSLAGERSASVGEISAEIPHSMFSESGEDEEDRDKILVQPEFPGLWSQECDLHKIPQEEMDLKQLATRVVKKGISQKKKEEFPTGIFHKQIASCHEHKGCAFYSKPSCIHFKDFDVGQVYKKKIVLINASYSVDCCRLVGISEWLKDFISVHFDPPGKMSPGMSCEVVVTFKPMINETLEGEVLFMAQKGSFAVPLKCTAKRCILALDKELIDFGSHVVGETVSQTISLTNSGALGTRFRVRTSAGDRHTERPSAESDHGRMVTQNLSDCVPEKEVSNSPVNSVTEVKEQIGSNHSEEMSYCATQVESQRTETILSRSSTQHLGQDMLNSRSDLDTDTAHNLVEFSPEETPVEIMLGKVTEGEIGPFSSVKLQILFVPAIPGDVRTEFVIVFDNSDCKPLCFSAVGVSMDMPVWVPNPNIDLKICMYDRVYQDCIVIQSRAKATLHLKFEVCKELSKHMELLPKTGYIQAQASFSVQLKFLPRHSLPQDARSYFNEETRILEVPVTILIVDKAKKVNITVHAIVTTSDLEISPAQINFGYCTIYEAVQANVVLTNKSILPQEFGFVGLPEFVEIQPNDGLGILLPLESLTLDIIFKANKAKDYSFELTCKSEINRQFKLSCKAVGVHPPLELSHSLVQFATTALNSVSTAKLYVMNPHVSISHFTHTVPRIGNGEVAPVGPTSFEFCVPEDCPVTIAPSVGTVLPGKKSLIQVSFRPTLSDQLIREEAVRRLCRAAAAGAEIQKKKKDEKRGGKKLSVFITRHQSSRQLVRDGGSKYPSSPCSSEQPKPEELMPDSEAYMAAQAFLRRTFSGRFEKYIIPCFVASGQIDEKKGSENLSYSPYNTLYLELHCPAVAPSVVVTSNNGTNTVDFGDVAVGHRMMKQLTIQNISPKKLELGFSVLNPSGPFVLVRAVGMLEPAENKPLIISFCPNKNKWSFETLEIWAAETTLTLSVTGRGVTPSVVCSVEEVLDMGCVIAKEKVTSTFKIQNTSMLTLRYSIQLDSLSPTRDKDRQRLPSFITSSLQRTELVGTQNYNGLSVFSVFPTEGEIVAGKSQDFVVTFSPDHESLYYSDCLKVVLFGKEIARVICLKGAARDHPVFVEGGVPLGVPIESLAVAPPLSSQGAPKEELQEPVKSILLALEYMDGESSPAPAVTELRIGAIQTARFAFKKRTEFSFLDLPLLQQKGFAVEPTQGTVEWGQVKRIRVSWVPPADFCDDDPPLVTALLALKGDVKESYQILFMTKIVSACAPTK
ncbi:cilia- and flagella-associated protein 74 isoform X2 [Pezoporus flaviventris]|uniref:cilia- and flagella-associated protein 74 isoform X2 n=1 Tax=Pezoporus flaviventris TaxID=889875 RepID=UPI002AB03F83|nr:cilia- and flagella-associated protein 74 isoform X2 [Pezoporus flaviventris]